jgi:hypothetical protein
VSSHTSSRSPLFLAHGQSADGEAVEVDLHQPLRALAPQMRIQGALHDAKHRLRRVLARRKTAHGPALRDLQGRACRLLISGGRDALIQHHHDVAADGALRLNAQFRTQQDALAIDVALKHRAFSVIDRECGSEKIW